MQSLGTRFSSGLGSVRSMVGLDGLEGLLQPKGFYDSIIILHLRQGSGFAGQCG